MISVLPITENYKIMVVQSGSMEPVIKTGSIVMIKPMQDYKIGDIISFDQITRDKTPITHRIYDIKVTEGQPIYITKGDANNAPDTREIQKKDVLGKVLFSIPFIGYAVDFAKKPLGFAIMILIPAGAIIGDEIKKIFKEIKENKIENK